MRAAKKRAQEFEAEGQKYKKRALDYETDIKTYKQQLSDLKAAHVKELAALKSKYNQQQHDCNVSAGNALRRTERTYLDNATTGKPERYQKVTFYEFANPVECERLRKDHGHPDKVDYFDDWGVEHIIKHKIGY